MSAPEHVATPPAFEDPDALPGLAAEPMPRGGGGPNEQAAEQTLAALSKAEMLDDTQAVLAQALRSAARQLDRAMNGPHPKDYGVANLVAQLRETHAALVPAPVEGGVTDAFDALARQIHEAHARSPAEVRDQP